MFPEICKIGPFTIYAYGLLLAIAFIAGSTLATMRARVENIDPDIIFNLSFLTFISGVIGARIFYVIENLSYYLKNPLEIIMLQHGGLSWYGGLFAGIISAVLYIKKRNLSVYKTLDLISPFLALGQAIGRIGCLLNGCCFGTVFISGWPLGIHNSIVIPVQIVSSGILTFIFVLLRFFQNKPHREGQIFFLYLLLYALKRFFVEFWRKDNPDIFLGLSLFQIISIAILILSALKLFSFTKIKKKNAGI
jgi:phosphatidylglycerol:prolipoprotein diacylglycerol transferase